MLSRRSLFSFLAGVGAAITGAKVVEAAPVRAMPFYEDFIDPKVWEIVTASHDDLDRFARLSRHFADVKGMEFGGMPSSGGYYPRGTIIMGSYISDGIRLRTLDSDEGQKILMESAVNVRADGSIRHRQHHPVDFPPRR